MEAKATFPASMPKNTCLLMDKCIGSKVNDCNRLWAIFIETKMYLEGFMTIYE